MLSQCICYTLETYHCTMAAYYNIFVGVRVHTCQLLSNLHVYSCKAYTGPLQGSCCPVYALQLLCVYCTIYTYTKYDMTSHCRAPKRGVGVILVLKMISILGRSAPSLHVYCRTCIGTCTCIYTSKEKNSLN